MLITYLASSTGRNNRHRKRHTLQSLYPFCCQISLSRSPQNHGCFRVRLQSWALRPAAGEHLATQLPLSQPQQGQINQETLPMVLPVRHSRYQKMSLLLCGPGQPRPLGSNLVFSLDELFTSHHCRSCLPCLSAPCHHPFHLHARSGDLLAAVQH